jgi:hypothetical protein
MAEMKRSKLEVEGMLHVRTKAAVSVSKVEGVMDVSEGSDERGSEGFVDRRIVLGMACQERQRLKREMTQSRCCGNAFGPPLCRDAGEKTVVLFPNVLSTGFVS